MASSSSTNIDLYVDEAYLLALINDEEPIPISDEKFALELHLQEALFYSSSFPIVPKTEQQEPTIPSNNRETGQSSQSKPMFCAICMEPKQTSEIFEPLLHKCTHSYCTECIVKYVATKIKENIASVQCPDPSCKRAVEPEDCVTILPKDVFGRWENALCESLVLGYQKFYCPYKQCSVMLIDEGGVEVRQSECPSCRKLFCARCRVGWHVGLTCEEYQRLGKDEREIEDVMVMNLAKEKEWKRCSNCRFYVEKKEGCTHMTCRCHYEFCYTCGGKWSAGHTC